MEREYGTRIGTGGGTRGSCLPNWNSGFHNDRVPNCVVVVRMSERVVSRFRRTHHALRKAGRTNHEAWITIMLALRGQMPARVAVLLAFRARHVWNKL